jgi:hypothetical protein
VTMRSLAAFWLPATGVADTTAGSTLRAPWESAGAEGEGAKALRCLVAAPSRAFEARISTGFLRAPRGVSLCGLGFWSFFQFFYMFYKHIYDIIMYEYR